MVNLVTLSTGICLHAHSMVNWWNSKVIFRFRTIFDLNFLRYSLVPSLEAHFPDQLIDFHNFSVKTNSLGNTHIFYLALFRRLSQLSHASSHFFFSKKQFLLLLPSGNSYGSKLERSDQLPDTPKSLQKESRFHHFSRPWPKLLDVSMSFLKKNAFHFVNSLHDEWLSLPVTTLPCPSWIFHFVLFNLSSCPHLFILEALDCHLRR